MFIVLCILALIIAKTAVIVPAGEFNREYLSRDNTRNIKGLFVILVLFSHYVQYVSMNSVWDEPYMALREHLNQMVVVPFLFYSGYGMMKSIQKKGNAYVKTIMSKRFFRVWFDFAVAVACFWVLGLALGKKYPIKRVLLSFVGWDSIGNSNWYILGTLILYFLIFIAFMLAHVSRSKWYHILGCALFTVFTIFVVFVFMKVGRPNYYYNTLVIFPVGCWYALVKERVDQFLWKNDFRFMSVSSVVICAYCFAYMYRWKYGIEGYTVWGLLFVLVFLIVTMKFSFKSDLIGWFGDHVFSVYILQRIPMMILSHYGWFANRKYMFLILSVLFTVVLAVLFERFTKMLRDGGAKLIGTFKRQ